MIRSNRDLNECDREPIHRLGRVQSFGFLLAVSRDWLITHASSNVSSYLAQDAQALIGQPLTDIISLHTLHALRNGLQFMASADSVERVFAHPLQGERLFDFAVHYSGTSIVIEAEPAVDLSPEQGPTLRAMVMRLQRPGDLLGLCKEATRQISALTGYDRVMVYRFDHDGSGEVIAEKAISGLQPFLGLRYPAGDVPKQARALYVRNNLRVIAEVSDTGSIIEHNPDVPALDLSLSVLRSVSPVHLEYLGNMGVRASLSISIIHQGQLWGLIACHHGACGQLSLERRTTAELFGQMFSLMLESRERDAQLKQELFKRALHDQLINRLGSSTTPVFQSLGDAFEGFQGLIDCDGIGLVIDGRVKVSGDTPDEQAFYAMTQFLDHARTGGIFATNALAVLYPAATAFVDSVAGLLAVPLSLSPGAYLVFFRKQWLHSIQWAGNPAKNVTVTDQGERLTPRKSFQAWSEQVSGQSRPWSDIDRATAEHLRKAVIEVILRVRDPGSLERQQAEEKHELLVAELNHRVRNILSLIRAVVGQSRDAGTTVEAFIQSVSGRIQALSLAHDQITADQWNAAPLRSLIDAEGQAYLSDGHERLMIDGPDVLLDPQAFSTVALVVHELMTNSTKHGALSDRRGEIAIDWQLDLAGRLTLTWQERGGPRVNPPSRRGFGSTIIERSIPFDLQGSAEVVYAPEGLRAVFVIPSAFVKPAGLRVVGKPPAHIVWPTTYQGRVLVLEDNIIIALEAEDILLKLGAREVAIASGVLDALRIIETTPPSFALLDFNLGGETSLPVALKLKQLNIPFAFATGYGNDLRVPVELADVTVIKKPYSIESFVMPEGEPLMHQ